MAATAQIDVPLAPEAREHALAAIQAAAEPVTAKQLAKLLTGPARMPERVLAPLLQELADTGSVFAYPAKTAKGQPRYWNRDVGSLAVAAIPQVAAQAAEPLTAKEFAGRLTLPLKLTDKELTPRLLECVARGTLFEIAPKTSKGAPRFWAHGPAEYARRSAIALLEAKGPQSEANLKKACKGLTPAQFQQFLDEALAAGQVWRHPPPGKAGKELLGLKPPPAEPYLREVGQQLAKVIQRLLAASVPRDEVRRSVVQMIEAAGISLPASVAPVAAPPSVDLVTLMRRLEPGADRGALVSARELRKLAGWEKQQFDQMVLELARQGRLALHRHDYATSLSPDEQNALVTDGQGTFYVGMALRSGAS